MKRQNANASPPSDAAQKEYWQFRINKSRGRAIGFKLKNIFYIVWLDPHHNLSDSAGYEKAKKYKVPPSEYEIPKAESEKILEENKYLKELLET